MAKKAPSKRKATLMATPGPELSVTGLSEGEMEMLSKVASSPAPFIGTSDSGLQTQNAELIKERGELNGKLEKAEKKIKELQDDLNRMKGELEKANTNLETNRGDNAALKDEIENKKAVISSKNDEIKSLNDQLKALKADRPDVYREQSEQRIATLESENETLKGEKTQLVKDLEKERNEKQALEDSVASLEQQLSEATDRIGSLQGELDGLKTQDRTKVIVTRSDARILRSQSFEDGNYDVRLAADRSYITFRRDPQGRALCWNHEIVIPKLAAYIDFDGEKRYEGEESDGIIRIPLR